MREIYVADSDARAHAEARPYLRRRPNGEPHRLILPVFESSALP
jgi:hypothetical protein